VKKVKSRSQKVAAKATAAKAAPSKIDHVVVLMLENRSFDHIFGFHPKVRGLKGSESNLLNPSAPQSASNPSFLVGDTAPYAVLAGQGPSHSINATNYQLTNDANGPRQGLIATNDGFARNYRDSLLHDNVPNPANNVVNVVMESFAPSALPSINALADAFCLCDNWYAEVPGPTQPNRFYMHAATSAGFGFNNWQRVMTVPTIYNSLQTAGRTWTTYSFDSNEVREFSKVNTQNQNFKQFQASFQADIQSNALANYSFVIPRFLNSTNTTHSTDGMANSQHAPQDARYGDNLVADVYDALRSNPQLWSTCCLIVTYDEHGGFYDHIAPPQNVPNPDGKNSPQPGDPAWAPVFAFDRLGLRVPAVIASPWVPAGKIDSTQYQHTSVLATLKAIFGLKNFLTKRDQSANNFAHLFDGLSQPRTDTPVTLPRAPLPKISVPVTDPAHPANHPLDHDQQDLLFKVFHLTKSSQPRNLTAASLPSTQGAAHDFIQQSYRKHFGPPAKPGVKPTARRHR
jgi:phospholipase C